MPKTNFERMIELVEEVFAVHNDPDQLEVDEGVIKQLERIHPATVSEHREGDGPVAWVLIIPTTITLMDRFVAAEISETELLNNTPLNEKYEALYLCSAIVLQEFRRKGLAKQLAVRAIKHIRTDHPIKTLFTWNFSKEGAKLAENLAQHESLPLLNRPRNIL